MIHNQQQKGFTIVELLIVIVVIAILAAISIVAYNGVTKKANASAAKANAETVQKVAESYNADETVNPGGGYPASATVLKNYTGSTRVPTALVLATGATSAVTAPIVQGVPDSNSGRLTISYTPLAIVANGGCVGYWEYDNATPKVSFVFVGAAKTASVTGSGTSGVVTCS